MTNLLALLLLFAFSSCQEEPCTNVEGRESCLKELEDGAPTPTPTATLPPVVTPDGPRDDTGETFYLWKSVSDFLVDNVDGYYQSEELAKSRLVTNSNAADYCHAPLYSRNRFSDVIAYFTEYFLEPRRIQLQSIASYYGMSSNEASYFPVGLMSHELCRVSQTTLSQTLRKVPGDATIALAQRFANDHNYLRGLAFEGNDGAKESFMMLWGKFFGCLAYTESLTTADSSSSISVAGQYKTSLYQKPAGVKFYHDPYQDEASRLNIGMFQFTPTASGNINPCLKQWEKDHPVCAIENKSKVKMIEYLGSPLQHFNTYCGIHKVLQTFSVQINSQKARNTHPDNNPAQGLKGSANRCVTPHFYAGLAYNHFGPLQNSTGSNLNKLLKCVYSPN